MSSKKVILITGGIRGVGFGTVQALGQESKKNTIVVASRKKADAEAAIAKAKRLGFANPFYPLVLDVTSDESVEAAVAEVKREFGRLDVLINNAGVGIYEDQESAATCRDAWARTFEINVTSVRVVTQSFLPLLQDSTSPRVINVSSARGSFARASFPSGRPTASVPYTVSKAALNMLTLEMGKAEPGISFYAVSPGHCRTALNDFKGKKDPADGGRCAAELAVAEEGMYAGGKFWKVEGDKMREVEW